MTETLTFNPCPDILQPVEIDLMPKIWVNLEPEKPKPTGKRGGFGNKKPINYGGYTSRKKLNQRKNKKPDKIE